MTAYLAPLAGGLLIGLAVALLLLLNGRIAGISGLVAGLFLRPGLTWLTNLAFVLGLLVGPLLYRVGGGDWPVSRIEASSGLLIAAGLLVGFGTRLGSGCTSGHGVAGVARLSPRSLVAVAVFLTTAVLTVFLQRLTGLS